MYNRYALLDKNKFPKNNNFTKLLVLVGDGHFSPVGGYHPKRDLILILDTARFKYPPHWISLELLWEAMHALDKTTGKLIVLVFFFKKKLRIAYACIR